MNVSAISTPGSWFDNLLDGHEVGNVEKRGFLLRAALGGYKITPRDETFDFLLDMSRGFVTKVLLHEPIESQHLLFVFPERWMSVQEQSQFISQLECHPAVMKGTLVQVDLVTQNALMVGNIYKEELVMFNMDGSEGFTTGELQQISAPLRKKLDERRKQ